MFEVTRIESIFLAARDRPALDRLAYLNEACRGDPGLRARVDAMLAAEPQLGRFLEPPEPTSDFAGAAATVIPAESAGTIIGAYKLLEQIGEGGFGVVFMAEQTQPVRRKVALKILKPGMDTRQVVARFEAERQALALMDHPNISKVFDGGATASGRPYFVMELVRGVPITDFCDQAHLPPRERLELFVQVCQAVQHAHQKGIIHRDLKPSNVLVSAHDGMPAVKVIDFGVAKAVGQQLTEKTLFTGFAQMLGTPLYMSPEQAAQSPDIDTRSDIYALGVLLYELLTGTTPFTAERFKQAAYDEIRRIIREEDPPRPSTRLAQSTETLPSISAQRQMELTKLTKLVRGELDWIVMRALEKERGRRYESAAALAADVRRYLADEPVQACPPSAGYKLRKFARRNKTVVATATVVCLAILLAVGGLAVSYVGIRDALWREKQALEREQQALYFQRIKTAARELAAGNTARAEQSLDDCPKARQGWEWHYLKRRRYDEPRVLPARDAVLCTTYSSDGRYLAAGCVDGSIFVWDTWNQHQEPILHQQTKHVYTLAFSRDGRYLASGGSDPHVFVWNVADGALLYPLLHAGTVRQLAFGPHGRFATAGDDGVVRLWDLNSKQEVLRFARHGEAVRGLAFNIEGQIVSAGASGEVKVWDPATGVVATSHRGQVRGVSYMAFHSPTGRLALGGSDGSVEIWDSPAAGKPRALDGHTKDVTGLAFNADGTRLVSAADDRALKLWDPVSGQEVLTIDLGDITPIGVAFGHDGQKLAVACGQRFVKVCDGTPLSGNEKKDELLSIAGHTDLVLRVDFDRDSRRLVSTSRDGTARVWDATSGQELLVFREHKGIVSAADFSPDGKRVASAGWDGKVLIWDAETGNEIQYFIADAGFVNDVDYSPDGKLLASAHANGTVIVWNSQTGEKVHELVGAHGYEAVSVSFDHDGERLATAGGRDHSAFVWDLRTAPPTKVALDFAGSERAPGRVRRATFSPDGRWVGTVGHGNTVRSCMMIWDAETGKWNRTIDGAGPRLFYLAFSPDGHHIAAGGQDDAVRVWDWEAPNEKEPHVLRGHAGEIHGLSFSPDGRLLASCGGYKGRGEIKVWDATRWKKD